MKKIVSVMLLCIVINNSCKTQEEVSNESRINYGNNIVVLLDLSNRILREKSIKDTTIVFSILDRLKPLIEKSIELGARDKLKIYSINQFVIDNIPNSRNDIDLELNIAAFKNELELSNYLYHNKENNYESEIEKIKSSVIKLYEQATKQNLGADMWYYLNDHLTTAIVDTTSIKTSFKNKNYITKRKNKIILLTDGYIEAGRYGNDITMVGKKNPNRTKYLSSYLTEKIRDDFNQSTYDDFELFVQDMDIGLIPINNALLSEVEMLVLEVDDRSIINGVTTKSPTDSRIIKLMWSNWLIESGMDKERFAIHDALKSKDEMELILNSFLN